MGMCRKPFMDIQPSDAAICDRAVGGVLPGRSKGSSFNVSYHAYRSAASGVTLVSSFLTNSDRCCVFFMMTSICVSSVPVACCSHRGLDYPRPHSIGSGSTASTTLSQSSSSSGRGSLPPAGYTGNQSQAAETCPAVCSSPEAGADNDVNSHHLRQHHLHHNCTQWRTPLSECSRSHFRLIAPRT